METVIVEHLSRTAISTAFPLVHLVSPKLDLQAWRRFAYSALDRRRGTLAGILTAKRIRRQHLCGMVCYRREPDLLQGQIMQVRNLIGIDILDAQPIILALIRFLGSLARTGGCSKLNILIPESEFSTSVIPALISSLRQPTTTNRYLNIQISIENLVAIEDTMSRSGNLVLGLDDNL